MAEILIVEDDPGAARLTGLALSMEGHDTSVARSGAELRDRLGGPTPELVILDVLLPDANGLELVAELREAPGWQDTRVVLLTALDSPEDAWRCWSSGADYYLTKPVELPLMRSVIERLLAGEQLRPGAPES